MNKKSDYTAVETGRRGKTEIYSLMPSAVVNSSTQTVAEQYGGDTNQMIGDDDNDTFIPITVNGVSYKYMPFGEDDDLPFFIKRKIADNMVTSECQMFNIQACYGQGLRFVNRDDKKGDTDDKEIRDFCLRNSLHTVFLEQATDMKYFFFSIILIILSRDGKKIVQVRPKEACYCRFEKAINGTIGHVFYGDFHRNRLDEIEVLPLLDLYNPLGDLMVRMGREPDPSTGRKNKPVKDRKFAIACRMPTPGFQYYPIPYYTAIFRDDWYDIYKLIGLGKKYMIKNTCAPRIQIEVHSDYWDNLCDAENISDPVKRQARIKKERQNIVDFVTGPENAGKALVTGYYIDPNGKEIDMVKIINLSNSDKEGGDYLEDGSEASNFICFAMGVHPNLIGAVPGKSQMNNSGSDKRELFTLKQSLEKPFHDIMEIAYHVILHYNGWAEKYTVKVPMIELTTLDENKSSKPVAVGNDGNDNKDNSDGNDNNKG